MRVTILAGTLSLALASPLAHAAGLDEIRAGNDAFAQGRYEAAVQAFSRGIQSGELDLAALTLALNNRGVAYNELGDFNAAITDYGHALKLRPGDATTLKNLRIAYIGRGAAAVNLGENDDALADYTKAIELDPKHPLALLRRGQLQLNRGNVQAAVADLEAARTLDPNDPDAQALLRLAQTAAAPTPPRTAARSEPPQVLPPPATPTPIEPAAGPASAAQREPPPEEPAAPASPSSPATPAPPAAAGMAAARPAADRPRPAPLPDPGGEGVSYRTNSDVNVRSGPGNDYPPSASLSQGTVVQVLGERLGWLQVRLPTGEIGFVYRKWLVAVGSDQP